MINRQSDNIFVQKRDGSKEPLDIDKIHRQVMWATEGLSGVSASEVEIRSQLQFYNGIKTCDIQETLIKAAADLIDLESPNYQYVAARLVNHHLRKEAYGDFTVPNLLDHVKRVVELGFYTSELLEWYDENEYTVLETYIDHSRDFLFTFAGMEQWRGKYLVKNRVTNQIFETPQMAYMLIAATLFHDYPRNTRLKWVKDYYDAISQFDISLPTPIMAGVRTPQKQFSSCVLIESDDSLDSISSSSHAIIRYVSRKAGIGLNVGRIRAKGSPVRKGDASHTGIVPFIKLFQSAVHSTSQGGVRGGSCTSFLQWWHLEFEDLVVLKNNKGVEDNRARHLDYCVQFNRLAYERLLRGQDISLFSPSDVPGLYDAFFADQDKFKELYEKYEADPKIRKKSMKAVDLFTMFMQERKNTGRIYFMNVDHANTHGAFIESKAPIRQSNLCCEITLPTLPLQSIEDDNPAIALCTLSAINWGRIREPKDFERPCRLAVRALDALLDYQEYPLNSAQNHTNLYRPLGIGIVNLAYWIAKMGFKYQDDSALETLDEYAEAWSYYMIKASVDLAKERGACKGIDNTKYALGIVPMDTRKAEVDDLVSYKERLPWAQLREDLKKYGIRNSTLLAVMPCECQSLDNKIMLADGSIKTLGEVLHDAGVDIEAFHEHQLVGQRTPMKPVELPNGTAYEAYYNGIRDVYEVDIDGDTYKFTGNHLLLVKSEFGNQWKQVDQLEPGDEIISI
jgi:ribonucleoside-diphosphate reductase alpha chain